MKSQMEREMRKMAIRLPLLHQEEKEEEDQEDSTRDFSSQDDVLSYGLLIQNIAKHHNIMVDRPSHPDVMLGNMLSPPPY